MQPERANARYHRVTGLLVLISPPLWCDFLKRRCYIVVHHALLIFCRRNPRFFIRGNVKSPKCRKVRRKPANYVDISDDFAEIFLKCVFEQKFGVWLYPTRGKSTSVETKR